MVGTIEEAIVDPVLREKYEKLQQQWERRANTREHVRRRLERENNSSDIKQQLLTQSEFLDKEIRALDVQISQIISMA